LSDLLHGGASNALDQEWQPYLSPNGPADQYAIEAAFGVNKNANSLEREN
jgi:hypothetical protein